MSETNVRSALVEAFVGGAFFDAGDIAWENQGFTPGANPWAAITFIPAQPEVATLGDAGQDELDGVFQIDLNFAPNSGDADAAAKFEAIRALFKAGASFTHTASGQVVRIRSCGRTHGRIVNHYYRVTVSVFFYSYISR